MSESLTHIVCSLDNQERRALFDFPINMDETCESEIRKVFDDVLDLMTGRNKSVMNRKRWAIFRDDGTWVKSGNSDGKNE